MGSIKPIEVKCTVNGKKLKLKGAPMTRLLDALRETALLTGTKEGCGEGECGACSVMLDGKVVNSCLVPLIQVDGSKVTTIEGIAKPGKLHEVQTQFIECGGAQCGICTPGMIVAAVDLLKKKPRATDAEIRSWLAGNLCRCTGYEGILQAVKKAARGLSR